MQHDTLQLVLALKSIIKAATLQAINHKWICLWTKAVQVCWHSVHISLHNHKIASCAKQNSRGSSQEKLLQHVWSLAWTNLAQPTLAKLLKTGVSSNCWKTLPLCVGFYLFPFRHTALSSRLFPAKTLFWSVTGGEDCGNRVTDGTGRLVLSAVGALREHGGTASTAVFTLCCSEAMKCDQQVRRDMSGHLTREARWLCGNTRSLVWKGISRITTILVVNTLQVCLCFKNHYFWLAVHEFREYACSENQKYSQATNQSKNTCKVS